MSKSSEVVSEMEETVELDDVIEVTLTNGDTISGTVTEGTTAVTIEPISGIVINYGILSDGSVFQSRWDDDPDNKSDISETQIGLVRDFEFR